MSIKSDWQEFSDGRLDDADEDIVNLMELSFYLGASSILNWVADGEITEEEFLSISKEVVEFFGGSLNEN